MMTLVDSTIQLICNYHGVNFVFHLLLKWSLALALHSTSFRLDFKLLPLCGQKLESQWCVRVLITCDCDPGSGGVNSHEDTQGENSLV